MNPYLKSYQVVMHTVGPVFIGSGGEIGKKEYLFLNKRKAAVLDIPQLYIELRKRRKADAFEEYLLRGKDISLTNWLEKQRVDIDGLDKMIKYKLDCGDAILDKGANKLQILECIKDAYGLPYIPGSSLKGMLRTVLIGADIMKNPEKYQRQKNNMRKNADIRGSRKNYLKGDMEDIEGTALRILNRPKTKPGDAVNDILQGLVISDSEPLSEDNLVLCQKIDRHTDGRERPLPILRECIKPDTEIRFTITVDTNVCGLSKEMLMSAVKLFITGYYRNFTAAFRDMDIPKTNYVYCGGGCGFVSKTILYPMYGKEEGINMAQCVFHNTGVPGNHKHYKDREYGASPHTIKCTRYKGKLMQMGLCKIKKIEEIV